MMSKSALHAFDSTPVETDLAATRRERFAHAWADLAERLSNGVRALKMLAAPEEDDAAAEAANIARLIAKRSGLEIALASHGKIAEAAETGDDLDWAFWAWQEQRIAVFDAYVEALGAGEAAMATGLALALDYMRGYGPDVDVPSLKVMLAGAGGGRA